MAGKLWIVGDSFFTRNIDIETGERLYSASWVDTFVSNCELEFKWESNSFSRGGNSNAWNLYCLHGVKNNPDYNCDTDTILFGATAVDRTVTSGHPDLEFDVSLGRENLRENRVKNITVELMLNVKTDQSTMSYESLKQQWHPDLLDNALEYYSTNWDYNWHHFAQCNWIDCAISDMRSSGSDIVFHRGCMYMWTQGLSLDKADRQTEDPNYNWRNTDLFDVPSFTLGMDNMEDVFKYNSHMSPQGSQRYGEIFTEWFEQR